MEQQSMPVGGQQQTMMDASLQKTVDAFCEAFNRFDAKAVASFWAEDGTLLNPLGHYARGRAGIEKVFADDAKRLLAGSTSRFVVKTARPVGDGCMFLDCDHEAQNCKMPDGSTGTRMLHLCVLAQRKGDGWQWLDARPYAFIRPEQIH